VVGGGAAAGANAKGGPGDGTEPVIEKKSSEQTAKAAEGGQAPTKPPGGTPATKPGLIGKIMGMLPGKKK
jgi:hypothetical protein